MKLLLRLGGFLLALFLLLTGLAYLLPSEQTVERSIQIDAPVTAIQPYIVTPKEFIRWSPWAAIDPNTLYSYSGATNGQGAKMSWKSDHRDVGQGTQTIDFVSTERINVAMDFKDQGLANAYYLFEPNDSGTKVTWGFSKEMGNNPFMRWMGAMVENFVGPKYEEGLVNLKNLVIKNYTPAETAATVAYIEPSIELTSTEAYQILALRSSSTTGSDTIGPALAEAYEKLLAAIESNELTMQGPPISIVNNYDNEKNIYEFTAAIPIVARNDNVLKDGIEYGESYAGQAVLAIHTGTYENLQTTYEKVNDYIAENNLQQIGNSWEQYISDPTLVAPDEVITHIYFPVAEATAE